jgi:hypothetical protein
MAKFKSGQLVVVSDLHIGSKLGLMPPTVELDDGNVVGQNSLQSLMWEFWTKEFWPEVAKRAKKRKTVVVLNGDLVDGNHHGTNQIWSNDPIEQANVASEILAPISAKYKTFVTRGTPAHVLASAASDEQIAREIGAAKPDADRKIRSSYHLKLNVEGALFDVAHHGPGPGNRIWTFGNSLRGYARTIVLDALVQRQRPPDCIIRSHVHHKIWETVRDYGHRCEAVITPAYQWKTEFGFKIHTHESVADVGGAIISIDDGKVSNVEFKLLTRSQSDNVGVA